MRSAALNTLLKAILNNIIFLFFNLFWFCFIQKNQSVLKYALQYTLQYVDQMEKHMVTNVRWK